jgi:DNA modification methylase
MLEARERPSTIQDVTTSHRRVSTSHKLIIGNSRSIRPEEVGSVELVVTSPPYGSIVDYGSPNQIGYGQDSNKYIADLEKVWKLCLSVLNPGCRMVINIGDQYVRANPKKGTLYHIKPLHAYIVNSILDITKVDVRYLGSIIWHKISTTHTTGGASVMGSYGYPRKVYPCFENEYLAIFEKGGESPKPAPDIKELAHISNEEWRSLTQGIWTMPGAKADENPAPFPEAIPARFIRMFTFPGETVFDPFVGSGTTMRAAASWGRNSVGIELGFKTLSGRSFQDVIRNSVMSAESNAPYVGEVGFSLSKPKREH